MSQVIALIPARSGSKGIPGKNWRVLGSKTLIAIAADAAHAAGIARIVVSTDDTGGACAFEVPGGPYVELMKRPDDLAQDSTPMFEVVAHAVKELGLNDSDIVVLLQPTAPFRTPAHIRQALALLRESGADSVVSLVQVPLTHHPDAVVEIMDGRARPFRWWCECGSEDWATLRTRRQDYEPTYIRDGTVYAFPVKTLRSGTIYGHDVRPLIIPPDESCELDTEADWADVERRWRERHG
jgi:CMP-N,N'-diacetyllegionaminic acid synthase